MKKEKLGFFLKEKGNEGQREHKISPKWKGHSLAFSKRTKNKKSSNYLLDARETATACTFQKSLIQAYRECKTSPEKKRMLGKAPISKRPEQKKLQQSNQGSAVDNFGQEERDCPSPDGHI